MDQAATNLLNYEAIGAMLVLTVLAIMWLANVFKNTTEDHTKKILEINSAHTRTIEEKDAKQDAQVNKLIADFTQERKDMLLAHAQERKEFTNAFNNNTQVLNNLYIAIEKRSNPSIRLTERNE